MGAPMVVWDPRMLGYDLGGDHPLHPLRWELTWLLAGTLGVLDHYQVSAPGPADDLTLGMVHTPGYIDAVRRASKKGFAFSVGHGLGTSDNPIFEGMHDNSALIAGASVAAARAIANGEVDRAVNFCGGLHHAMADHASGFCVYNDAALAIAWCSPPQKFTARSTSPRAIARAAATDPPAINAAASCIPGKIGSSAVPSPCPTENGKPVADARRTASI